MMNPFTKNKTWAIGLTLCTFGILVILYLAYNRGIPHFVARVPHYDLIGHFFLYGAWSYLAYRSFDRQIEAPAALSGITIAEELAQMLSANRTFSLVDLFFSLLGIWLIIFIDKTLLHRTN